MSGDVYVVYDADRNGSLIDSVYETEEGARKRLEELVNEYRAEVRADHGEEIYAIEHGEKELWFYYEPHVLRKA